MRRVFYLLILLLLCHSITAQDTLLLLNGKKIVVSSVDLQGNTIAYRSLDKTDKLRTIDPDRVFSVLYKDGHERVVYQTDSLDPMDFKVEEMRSFINGVQDARKIYRNNFIKGSGLVIGAGSAYFAIWGLVGPPLYSTVLGSFNANIEKIVSFRVSGDAASEFGIAPRKYMNEVSGDRPSPVIKKNQQLNLGMTSIKFTEDTPFDKAIGVINSKSDCSRVYAENDGGKLKLYRVDKANLSNQSYREGFEKRVRDYKIRNAMLSGLIGFVAGTIAYSVFLKDDNGD